MTTLNPSRKAVDSVIHFGLVELRMESDDGLDTRVGLAGSLWIAGEDREDFKRDVEELIARYRI